MQNVRAKFANLNRTLSELFGDQAFFAPKKKLEADFCPIADFLPFKFCDEEEKIFINEESLGFILETGSLFGANPKDLEVVSNLLRDSVPEGSHLQVINYASPIIGDILQNYALSGEGNNEAASLIAAKRAEFIAKGSRNDYLNEDSNYRIRNFRVFFVFSIPLKNKGWDLMDKIARLGAKSEEGEIGLKIKEACSIRKNFKSLLSGIGLGASEVDASGLLCLADEILNANALQNRKSDKAYNKCELLSSQAIDIENRIEVLEDGVSLFSDDEEKNLIAKAFSFKRYPIVFSQGEGVNLIGELENDLGQIPCAFLQTICVFFPFKAQETKSKIGLKAIKLQKNRENPLFRFFPSIAEESDEYNFISKKLEEGQRLVEIYSGVLLLCPPKDIEGASRVLTDIYARRGFALIVDKYLALQSFLSFLPFVLGDGLFDDLRLCKRIERVLSWNVANLMPLQGEAKGSSEPCMMLFGRRGQIYGFHPFKSPAGGNFNTCIVGKSGSGKSFFMQDYMMSIARLGGRMIVIDDGQSFQKMCSFLGGKYIEFSEGNNICLNPFTLLKKEEELKVLRDGLDAEAPDRANFYDEVISFIIKMIRAIISREDEMCSKTEGEIISFAVKEAAKRFGWRGDLKCVCRVLMERYADKGEDRPSEVSSALYTIALRMKSFAEGEYSRYFTGEANVEIDEDCVVFELSHIKDKPELQRIATLFASFLGFKEMYLGSRKQIKSFVVDEAWSLLAGREMAEFMEGMARRARKYNGQLVIATQSIEDFYKSAATTAILQNSDYLCIMAQKPESITALEKSGKVGDMSPRFKNALLSIRTQKGRYSEVVIYAHGSYCVARLIVDPFSAKLYSSDAKDFAAAGDLMKKGYSLAQALEILIDA